MITLQLKIYTSISITFSSITSYHVKNCILSFSILSDKLLNHSAIKRLKFHFVHNKSQVSDFYKLSKNISMVQQYVMKNLKVNNDNAFFMSHHRKLIHRFYWNFLFKSKIIYVQMDHHWFHLFYLPIILSWILSIILQISSHMNYYCSWISPNIVLLYKKLKPLNNCECYILRSKWCVR